MPSRTPPPARPTFFLDQNVGSKTMLPLLRSAGWWVELHHDHFSAIATPDTDWLEFCGKNGWVALTPDQAISKDVLARRVIKAAKTQVVLLSTDTATALIWAATLITHEPALLRQLARQPGPAIFRLTRSGTITIDATFK